MAAGAPLNAQPPDLKQNTAGGIQFTVGAKSWTGRASRQLRQGEPTSQAPLGMSAHQVHRPQLRCMHNSRLAFQRRSDAQKTRVRHMSSGRFNGFCDSAEMQSALIAGPLVRTKPTDDVTVADIGARIGHIIKKQQNCKPSFDGLLTPCLAKLAPFPMQESHSVSHGHATSSMAIIGNAQWDSRT